MLTLGGLAPALPDGCELPVTPLLTHLGRTLAAVSLLVALDQGLIRPAVDKRTAKARDRELARWFFVHALANALVVGASINSCIAVLRDPIHAMDACAHPDTSFFGSGSQWPLTLINSVHIYHMVGGFTLSSADYFHHLLFIPTLGFPGQYYLWGALANWQAFFISGLPGGCDYLMLGLLKIGWLKNSMLEKRASANLNTWLRAPGILVATVLLYQALVTGLYRVPFWAALLQLMLPPYNALYFGKQATANYAVHYMLALLGQDELIRQHIQQRTSVTTGTRIMAWKDALGEPQRAS